MQGNSHLAGSSLATSVRIWRSATVGLALLLIGGFVVQAQPVAPPSSTTDAQPNGRIASPGTIVLHRDAVQPSNSVEATALAIAYHASLQSGAKLTPENVGKAAAELLNAFTAARK